MARFDRPCISPPYCNYRPIALYLVPFARYLTLNNTVTLKSGLEVTRGH